MLKSAALATTLCLFGAGCAELSPGENAAVFGGLSALTAGGIARAAGASTAQSLAIGAATGAVVAMTTYIIAKHQATERQRRIAEQRVRAYYARHARQAPEKRVALKKRKPADARAPAEPEMAPRKRVALKNKKVRYLAVDTERNEKTSPNAKKAVMIWDTQSEQMVGNDVYDVQSPPPVGSTAKFETYSAEYVGGGG